VVSARPLTRQGRDQDRLVQRGPHVGAGQRVRIVHAGAGESAEQSGHERVARADRVDEPDRPPGAFDRVEATS